MVSSKGTPGMRRGRAYSTSTGNPVEDKLIQQQSVTPKVTPSRPKTAQPIAIPDSGKARRNTSPRSNQSGSPRGYRSDSSSKSPTCGNFYAGAKVVPLNLPNCNLNLKFWVNCSLARLHLLPVFPSHPSTGPHLHLYSTRISSKRFPTSSRCSSTSRPEFHQSPFHLLIEKHTWFDNSADHCNHHTFRHITLYFASTKTGKEENCTVNPLLFFCFSNPP